MRLKKPPRLAEWIVRRLSQYESRFSLDGDLREVFEDIARRENEGKARSWYWSQTRRALIKYPVLTWRMNMGMLKNHITLALRSMKKHKGYTFINLVGLAAGLACCMIILVYVNHELSYDMYHPDVERIYRVLEYRKVPAGEFIMARISPMVAIVLDEQFTQVEHTVRIMPVSNVLVRCHGIPFYEDRVMYTDASLLDVFSIPVLKGNPEEALKHPGRAVLTSSLAKKYFGNEDPMGKEMEIIDPLHERVYGDTRRLHVTVSGVVADPPSNTHVKQGILLSLQVFRDHPILSEWHAGMTHTYVKLSPNTQLTDFEKAIERLAYDYVSRDLTAWGQTREYFLQPMKDIHFCREIRGLPVRDELEPSGSRAYFTIYGVIAMLILLIGTMNFVNLSNARAVYRIKEVGLRKVLGAKRRELIRQFLSESVLITLFASGFGFLLARVLLPFFVAFSGSTVSYSALFQPRLLLATGGLVLFIGLLSGLYPAFVLTTFKPDRILRGTSSWTRGSSALRVLVVGQFVISIFLAVGTLTVSRQLAYMRGGNLGFQTEAQYVIPFRRNGEIRKQVKVLKTELLKHPQVLSAAASSSVPGRPMWEGHLKWSDDKLDKPLKLVFLSCDEDFLSQFRIGMAARRAFDEAKNDENSAFIIN